MSEPIIIGIIGKKGHGKSEVAARLNRTAWFEELSFADPIKQMLQEGLGISDGVLHGDASIKEQIHPAYGVSVRKLMQTLGTDWGRNMISEDIWVRALVEHGIPSTIERLEGAGRQPRIVVSDVRFPNEAAALIDKGAHLVRVVRPGFETGKLEDHASETSAAVIGNDWLIDNSGPIEWLRLQTDAVADCIVDPESGPGRHQWIIRVVSRATGDVFYDVQLEQGMSTTDPHRAIQQNGHVTKIRMQMLQARAGNEFRFDAVAAPKDRYDP